MKYKIERLSGKVIDLAKDVDKLRERIQAKKKFIVSEVKKRVKEIANKKI